MKNMGKVERMKHQLDLLVKPDFIIIGAMKCGTTSMHRLLGGHPDVFIPDGEVQLLSLDDIEQNPVFFPYIDGRWTSLDFENDFGQFAAWHKGLYEGWEEGQLRGEDAPSYLPSKKAIDRIARMLPDTKLVVLLRDPVDRLYSQYWHWVRTYRATQSFEDTIRFQARGFLQRSYYEEQLRYCFQSVPMENVHVVLFEEFIRDQNRIVAEVLSFLGLRSGEYAEVKKHANKGKYPSSLKLALLKNRIFSGMYGQRYLDKMPGLPKSTELSTMHKLIHRSLSLANPLTPNCPVSPNPETRKFLSRLLYKRNEGLSELLGRDLSEYWPSFAARG